jgi:hypothetical protein
LFDDCDLQAAQRPKNRGAVATGAGAHDGEVEGATYRNGAAGVPASIVPAG